MDTTIQLKIDGMTCSSCVSRVEKALHKVTGVITASVNLATETATIESTASNSEIIDAVIEAGYQVPVKSMQFGVGGMSCSSRVSRIEKALFKVTGVVSASVNLATEQVLVKSLLFVTVDQLEQEVTQAGYSLIVAESGNATNQLSQHQAFYQKAWWPVLGSSLLTLPLVLPMLGMLFAEQRMLPAFW